MPREELRKRLSLQPRDFGRVEAELVARGLVVQDGPFARRPDFAVRLTPDEERRVGALLGALGAAGAMPPVRAQLEAGHGLSSELVQVLAEDGLVVEVGSELIYDAETYRRLVAEVKELIARNGKVTVGELRDAFGASRRYALALLEHLDERKVTRRVGDERVLA
jgi:selenocysteine-specific elongation factor